MSVKLKFKNVSLVTDTFGQHLAVKMVQVYKDDNFLKNAKINKQLMDTIYNISIPLNPIDLDADVENLLTETAKKYKSNINDFLKFLLQLNQIDAEKGAFKVEKTILYLMHIEKKRYIDDKTIRTLTECNLNVIKKAIHKHKKQIDAYNANLKPRLF